VLVVVVVEPPLVDPEVLVDVVVVVDPPLVEPEVFDPDVFCARRPWVRKIVTVPRTMQPN